MKMILKWGKLGYVALAITATLVACTSNKPIPQASTTAPASPTAASPTLSPGDVIVERVTTAAAAEGITISDTSEYALTMLGVDTCGYFDGGRSLTSIAALQATLFVADETGLPTKGSSSSAEKFRDVLLQEYCPEVLGN